MNMQFTLYAQTRLKFLVSNLSANASELKYYIEAVDIEHATAIAERLGLTSFLIEAEELPLPEVVELYIEIIVMQS